MPTNPSMMVKIGVEDDLLDYLRTAQSQVKRFDNNIKKSGSVVQAYGAEHSQMTKRFKFFRGALQQAGYQVGDYAVQVANGTSHMQAFGQQGSQLLGIFGPIGAILGAVVAVVSAVGVAAQKSAKSTAELKNETISLSEALSMLERDVGVKMDSIAKTISRQFSAASTVVQEFFDATERRDVSILKDAIEGALPAEALRNLKQLTQEVSDFEEAIAKIRSDVTSKGGVLPPIAFASQKASITQLKAEISSLESQFGVSASKAQEMINQLNAISSAANRNELISALSELRRTVANIDSQPARELHKELVNLAVDNNLFQPVIDRAKELEEQIGKTAAAQIDLNKVIFDPRDPNFDPVIAEFARLQLGIKAAKDEAAGLQSVVNKIGGGWKKFLKEEEVIFDPRDPRYDKMRVLMAQISEETGKVSTAAKAAGGSLKEMTASVTPELDAVASRMQQIGSTIADSFGNAFMSVVDGTMTAKDAFKSMAASIIKELYQIFVVKKITGFISGMFNMNQVSGPAMPLGTGNIRPVARPPGLYTGGTATGMRPHIVGEKGPELFIPGRTGQVVANDKMGGGGVTVIQNNTFGAGVSRAEINAMMPRIVETTKAAVLDAKRRGGSYGRAMS